MKENRNFQTNCGKAAGIVWGNFLSGESEVKGTSEGNPRPHPNQTRGSKGLQARGCHKLGGQVSWCPGVLVLHQDKLCQVSGVLTNCVKLNYVNWAAGGLKTWRRCRRCRRSGSCRFFMKGRSKRRRRKGGRGRRGGGG